MRLKVINSIFFFFFNVVSVCGRGQMVGFGPVFFFSSFYAL